MIRSAIVQVLVMLVGGVCLAGCATAGPSPMSFSVRRIATADQAAAFDAARAVLVDRGYRVELAEPQAGRLTTYPQTSSEVDNRGRMRRREPRRHVAEIRVGAGDAETSIFCRVLSIQQTTEAHRLLAMEQGSDDLPGRTPIEREAATGHAQNVVWETTGRNKRRERAILNDILVQLGAHRRTNQ